MIWQNNISNFLTSLLTFHSSNLLITKQLKVACRTKRLDNARLCSDLEDCDRSTRYNGLAEEVKDRSDSSSDSSDDESNDCTLM